MNKFLLILLFLVLCTLIATNGFLNNIADDEIFQDNSIYTDGFLKENFNEYESTAKYNIKALLNIEQKEVVVKERIVWYNKTKFETNKLYFHLYLNGYSGNHTIFSKRYTVDSETSTRIQFKNITVNSDPALLKYISNDPEFPLDSTVASIKLSNQLMPEDSVIIEFEYSFNVPKSLKRLGYASGRNFYFISQWFPKLGVFENGEWNCSPFYHNTNFYSDFADYEVELSIPAEYEVASTGVVKKVTTYDDRRIFQITQNAVHDFVWMASDEINKVTDVFTRNDSSQVLIELFLQPEDSKYLDRYLESIKYTLSYFEDNIGSYPYQTLTCVDPPRTSNAGGMEYPTLFTVRSELFSREKTLRIESVTIHEFIHQYFQGIVANDEVNEAWLDEGISAYLTSLLVQEKYGAKYSTFRFLDFISVEGINFLQYNEIPLIYTLGDFTYTRGYRSFQKYYECNSIGAISDASFEIPRIDAYYVNSYYKPELLLMSLERIVGKQTMVQIFQRFFEQYKFRHPKGSDFFRIVEEVAGKDLTWFWEAYYQKNKIFDYGITNVRQIKDNIYEVDARRFEDGIAQTEIALVTESDTLYKQWDGKERFKIVRFETDKNVLGAEIDPLRKNLFDLNFSNNSFTTERRYAASFSFSMRWFFWIQNVLMILGSIA